MALKTELHCTLEPYRRLLTVKQVGKRNIEALLKIVVQGQESNSLFRLPLDAIPHIDWRWTKSPAELLTSAKPPDRIPYDRPETDSRLNLKSIWHEVHSSVKMLSAELVNIHKRYQQGLSAAEIRFQLKGWSQAQKHLKESRDCSCTFYIGHTGDFEVLHWRWDLGKTSCRSAHFTTVIPVVMLALGAWRDSKF
ncbi:hypothetical protein BT96DRAFT_972227 [Gymnopus androsaceus JB14]|uniref:Uncharacterized protein n=1 Tax=Gymnopus androsaceus JB14 TaxID=1447944 RepID=A0A6A4IBC6_9AGAR|nr:hypothetical protein BT96DRAFT_972227 [Gymnopus androsaceus JB14]